MNIQIFLLLVSLFLTTFTEASPHNSGDENDGTLHHTAWEDIAQVDKKKDRQKRCPSLACPHRLCSGRPSTPATKANGKQKAGHAKLETPSQTSASNSSKTHLLHTVITTLHRLLPRLYSRSYKL